MKTAGLAVAMLVVSFAFAQEPARGKAPKKHYLADLSLVDQDGNVTDLYALLKGRTIVMSSFFTACTESAPVMRRTFDVLQEQFADRIGKDLVLVSITVDPTNDTPAKLKSYARGAKAADGRYLLTGSSEQVADALKRIGQLPESREQHSTVIIIGNDRTGLWKKALGVAPPEEIVKIVRSVLEDEGWPAN